MKKKLDADDEDMEDRLEKQKKKHQSDFMKQLTDIAQQVVEPTPAAQLEPFAEETQVNICKINRKFYIHFEFKGTWCWWSSSNNITS